MKKTLIAMFALASMAMADSDLTWMGTWNISGASLPSEGSVTTVTVDPLIEKSAATVTITTTGSALIGGTTDYGISTDAGHAMPTIEQLDANVNDDDRMSTSIGSYIKGNKGDTLTLTIGNLEAGKKYNVSLVSGVTFEGPGAWINMNFANDCDSRTAYTMVPAKALGGWIFEGVTPDAQGQIVVSLTNTGSHSPAFNAVGLAMVPEPATATLSLLALAGLAARRRRH